MNKTVLWITVVIVAALVVYLTVLRIVPSNTPQDDMVAVQCTGKTVYRYKDAANMFPVITQDYSASFALATGVLGKLAGDSGNTTASADVKSAAQRLIDTLDQDNIFFQNMLKAYFLESNDDPCNDSLRFLYTSFIQEMTDKQIQLKQFIAQVTNPPQTNTTKGGAETGGQVLAVVDTTKGKVNVTTPAAKTGQVPANRLVVLNNYGKLNTAVAMLSHGYGTTTKFRAVPVYRPAPKK